MSDQTTDFSMMDEIISVCVDKEWRVQAETLRTARREIERLRASQFRWIPVSERLPDGDGWVFGLIDGRAGMTNGAHLNRAFYTHWAPIPPLPEKSQDEKDKEMWKKWLDSETDLNDPMNIFLAGLRAARESK